MINFKSNFTQTAVLFLLTFSFPLIISGPPIDHWGSENLDGQGNYLLEWHIITELETIYFTITAKTKGFVGFGISPSGSMNGADIFIAGVNPDGSKYSSDYHGVGLIDPVKDQQSDWTLNSATETETHTELNFSRLLNTCDKDDIEITDGTMRLIWALGETDNITYHGGTNRGTKSVNFYLFDEPESDLEEFEKLDMIVDIPMPAQHTSYWCSIHRAPIFDTKQHIVAFDAILENAPALQHTHHFIMYRCIPPGDQNPEDIFDKWVSHPGDHCFGPANESFPFLQYCSRFPTYIWSKGGKRLTFPPNMGLPMPEILGLREYYALEIHYDNPKIIENLKFKTGGRMYYSNGTRETEVGLLVMNHNVVPQLTIPPKTKDFIVAGHCSGECTEAFLPEDGITIFNNLFHAHLAGRKLKLRHFRGNEELQWIDVDEFYDFDFQQNKPLRYNRQILRGDQLIVECTFDSTTAEGGKAVIGGPSTFEEMCEATVYYYPKQDFFYCGSNQDVNQHFSLLGVTDFTEKDPEYPGGFKSYDIIEPEYLAGDYRDSVSFKVNWTEEFRKRFQEEKRYGEQIGTCNAGLESRKGPVRYPDVPNYVPPNKCQTGGGTGVYFSLSPIFLLMIAFIVTIY